MIINSAQGPGGKSKRFDLIRTWRDRIFFIGFLLAILVGVAGLVSVGALLVSPP